jgi:hypothetical protein
MTNRDEHVDNRDEILEILDSCDAAVMLAVHDNGEMTTVNGAVWKSDHNTSDPTYSETMLAALNALTSMCLETVGPRETVDILTEALKDYSGIGHNAPTSH